MALPELETTTPAATTDFTAIVASTQYLCTPTNYARFEQCKQLRNMPQNDGLINGMNQRNKFCNSKSMDLFLPPFEASLVIVLYGFFIRFKLTHLRSKLAERCRWKRFVVVVEEFKIEFFYKQRERQERERTQINFYWYYFTN